MQGNPLKNAKWQNEIGTVPIPGDLTYNEISAMSPIKKRIDLKQQRACLNLLTRSHIARSLLGSFPAKIARYPPYKIRKTSSKTTLKINLSKN